jgi:hypothetical protein
MDVDHSNRCSLAIFIARGSIQNTSMRSTTAAADKTYKIAITPQDQYCKKSRKSVEIYQGVHTFVEHFRIT